MAGVNKVRTGHDDIYEATVAIDGGILVVPAAGATHAGVQGIAIAGDAAHDVLGVTARRAEPVANQNLAATDGDGYPVAYPNPVSELTAVYKGCVVPVTYTAAAVAYGVKLVAAANGHVRAYVPSTSAVDNDDPRAVIGECRVVGGMGGAGGVGLALIY